MAHDTRARGGRGGGGGADFFFRFSAPKLAKLAVICMHAPLRYQLDREPSIIRCARLKFVSYCHRGGGRESASTQVQMNRMSAWAVEVRMPCARRHAHATARVCGGHHETHTAAKATWPGAPSLQNRCVASWRNLPAEPKAPHEPQRWVGKLGGGKLRGGKLRGGKLRSCRAAARAHHSHQAAGCIPAPTPPRSPQGASRPAFLHAFIHNTGVY